MINSRRGVRFIKAYNVIQADHFSPVVSYKKVFKVAGVIPVAAGHLSDYLVLFAIFGKVSESPVTESQLQCLRNIIYTYAELRGF